MEDNNHQHQRRDFPFDGSSKDMQDWLDSKKVREEGPPESPNSSPSSGSIMASQEQIDGVIGVLKKLTPEDNRHKVEAIKMLAQLAQTELVEILKFAEAAEDHTDCSAFHDLDDAVTDFGFTAQLVFQHVRGLKSYHAWLHHKDLIANDVVAREGSAALILDATSQINDIEKAMSLRLFGEAVPDLAALLDTILGGLKR